MQDLHAEANQLRQVKELGGISQEKTQTRKWVMEYLGNGDTITGRRRGGRGVATANGQRDSDLLGAVNLINARK